MHPYIKRALVFAALVIAGLGLLDAEERTQHHALQSRERRAPVSSEVRWMVTPNVSLDFMPLPVGVPLALQRQFDVEIIDTVNALYNCVPRANVDACAVTVGCDPSDTKCLCGKLDYDFYFCLYQVRVAGNTMCDYKYSPENQPVYDFRHGFATYCTDKNLGYLSITGPSPWLTSIDKKMYSAGPALARCMPLTSLNSCIESTGCAINDRACVCYQSKTTIRSCLQSSFDNSNNGQCSPTEANNSLNNYVNSLVDFCTEKRLATGPQEVSATTITPSSTSTLSTTPSSQPTVTPVATVTLVAKTSSATTGPAVSSLASISIVAIVALLVL